MAALLAGICIQRTGRVCPAGDVMIKDVYLLVGGFVLIGIIGLLWLGIGRRRG